MTTRDEEHRLDTAGRIRSASRSVLGILLLIWLGASGCGRSGEHAAHGMFGMQHLERPLLKGAMHLGMRGMRGTRSHGIRRACAGDVQRLCPKSGSRREERECLEGKRETVSAECRAALDARRNGSGETAR
ncbi:MAG TPA: hypothetical protein VHX61_07580 [Rhizomicrobium sp.]|jgi:hypothetical protein|nr:hypothetical protein [Rhizomicrobium sp.]